MHKYPTHTTVYIQALHRFFSQKLCAIVPHIMGVSNKTCGHCKYKLPVLATMCIAQIAVQNISTALQPTSIGITNTLQCSELIEPEGTFNNICWYLQHI